MGAPLPAGTTPAAQRDWAEYLKTHARELGYAVGAVVVVVGAVWLYFSSEARKEAFASQALAQARSEADAGNLPLAANDLSRLIDRYAGTRAADEAVVALNDIRLNQGVTDLAITNLRSFVAKRHPNYVLASAYALLGGGLENQRKFKEAAEAYRKASENATHDFLKAQYLLDAGRVLTAAGDSAAARAAYGELLQKYDSLNQAAEARVRMGEVGGTVPPTKPATPGSSK